MPDRDAGGAFTVVAGQYVLAVRNCAPFAAGDLGLVTEAGATLTLLRAAGQISPDGEDSNEKLTIDLDAFFQSFKPVADGGTRLQQLINQATEALSPANVETAALATTIANLQPGFEALSPADSASPGTGEPSVAEQKENGLTMRMGGQALSAEDARSKIASMRNAVARVQKTMLARRRELEALLGIQTAALEIQMKGLQRMVAGAEDLITTINLYLGKTLQVERLRTGKPAPSDTPVTINQLVLYMDEECAIAGEKGGIDVDHLDLFTDWLLEPGNLDRVFQHPKGIVAFHVRRKTKEYTDPWEAMAKSDANIYSTWFLVRNGERLDWLTLDISVGTHLVPYSTEFDELFWSTATVFGRHLNREPLDPGSDDYLKAMERANAKQRHYMRIAIFLQGLFDRTTLFAPLPDERINVLNPSTQGKYVNLNLDGEVSRQLSDGRPSFRDWQRTANEALDVGHRVVGVFGHWTHGVGNDWERIRPWKAPRPDRNGNLPNIGTEMLPDQKAVHTIASSEGTLAAPQFVIRYPRRDKVWSARERTFSIPKTGASLRVQATDSFILNLDAVSESDISYYLTSRRHRHEYEYMWPILRLAKATKEAERKTEAPFRRLLEGELLKAGAEPDTAAATVEDLAHWWKFKSATHRALLADDTKALRMIVSEFRRRRRQSRPSTAAARAAVVGALLEREPNAVLVARSGASDYVVFIPENGENVFISRHTWKCDGDDWRQTSVKRWTLADHTIARLDVLYSDDRWAQWRTGVRPSTVLTDPERDEVIRAGWEVFDRAVQHHRKNYYSRDPGRHVFRPLSARVSPASGEIRLFAQTKAPHLPSPGLDAHPEGPDLTYITLRWARKSDSIRVEPDSDKWSDGVHTVVPMKAWEPGNDIYGHLGKDAIVWQVFNENVAAYQKDKTSHDGAVDAHLKLENAVRRVTDAIHEEATARHLHALRSEWLADGNDEDMWEDHLATLKKSRKSPLTVPTFHGLRGPVASLLVAGRNMAGMTVGEILGSADSTEEPRADAPNYPLDFVISEEVLDEESDEELEEEDPGEEEPEEKEQGADS